MTRTRLLLAVLLSVAVLVGAGCGGKKSSSSTSTTPSTGNTIATVAGQAITRAQLDDLMAYAEVNYKQDKRAFPKAGTAEYQALQKQAAVFLVTQTEYEQQAGKLGVKVTEDDISKGIDAIIKTKQFGGSQQKFDAYLKKTGFTLAQFRAGERRQLLETRLSKAVTKDVVVTAAAVQAYYDSHKDAAPYTTPAQRRVRHILVAVNAKGQGISDKGVKDTKIDFAKSKQLADRLYARIKGGASFGKLVKTYSQDGGSKDKGGEYTDVKGTFVKEFEASAFSLKTLEVSKPVKSQFGYHLIQALEPVKAGSTTTFAQAQKGIRSILLQQKQQAALQTWAAGLGKIYKGKVTYSTGFEPPTTSVPTVTTGSTTTP